VTSGEPLFSSINAAKPFGGRAPPGPAGGAHSAPPDPLAGCRGPLRGGRGGGRGGEGEREGEGKEGNGKGRKGEEREGREGEGEGREGRKGRDADFPLQELLIAPPQCRGE
jgi:hypothetical protein